MQCHIQEGYPDHRSASALHDALLNLVQNAVRYADGHVHVSVTGCPEGGFQLIVDDDGPGIPAAERENIFEPFIRLDDSRDRARAAPAWAGDRQAGGGQPQWQHRSLRQPAGRRALRVALAGRDKGTLAPALAAQDADSRRADGCGSADASPSTSTTWPPPGGRR